MNKERGLDAGEFHVKELQYLAKIEKLEKELKNMPRFRMDDQLPSLSKYIKTPTPPIMFDLGFEYERLGQTASAIGYYHKCAERSSDDGLAYEALLRIAICYDKQGERKAHEKNTLLMAIALQPERPEGYFLLCMLLERYGDVHWWENYTYACIGHTLKESEVPLLRDINYPGTKFFLFQQAVCLWWLGRFDEARTLLTKLDKGGYDYPDQYTTLIKSNLETLENNQRAVND